MLQWICFYLCAFCVFIGLILRWKIVELENMPILLGFVKLLFKKLYQVLVPPATCELECVWLVFNLSSSTKHGNRQFLIVTCIINFFLECRQTFGRYFTWLMLIKELGCPCIIRILCSRRTKWYWHFWGYPSLHLHTRDTDWCIFYQANRLFVFKFNQF